MLHIYPKCGIFYLPSTDTGTKDNQLNMQLFSIIKGNDLINLSLKIRVLNMKLHIEE